MRLLAKLIGALQCWLTGSHILDPYSGLTECGRCGRVFETGRDWD